MHIKKSAFFVNKSNNQELIDMHHFKALKRFYFIILACLTTTAGLAQSTADQQEFDDFIKNIETEYIYYQDKKEIIDCIKQDYRPYLDTISHPFYKVIFYELLLNELYDSHVHLMTNTDISYRLNAPVYVKERDGRFYISSVFSSQLEVDFPNIMNAEVRTFNGQSFEQALRDFPSRCHDKKDPQIREWLANKILAGKLNLPRALGLTLSDGSEHQLDLDDFKFKSNNGLLTSSKQGNIGIIRINNSLSNSDLVAAFNTTLDGLMDTDALILDLRNTSNGGNTGVAEPIMGRFIDKQMGYQVCESKDEKYTRFAYPKGATYSKPLYVLVGRWTGSMSEGMCIGLDGMKRATVVGTEMYRLAGGMKDIQLLNSNYAFKISIEKMYHLDGSLRETFVPNEYINQQSVTEDEFLKRALALIKKSDGR